MAVGVSFNFGEGWIFVGEDSGRIRKAKCIMGKGKKNVQRLGGMVLCHLVFLENKVHILNLQIIHCIFVYEQSKVTSLLSQFCYYLEKMLVSNNLGEIKFI